MRVTLRLSEGLSSEQGMLNIVELGAGPFVIGRATEADWTLIEPTNHISGIHVELRSDGKDLVIVDRSSGGTAINTSANRSISSVLDDQSATKRASSASSSGPLSRSPSIR